MTNEELNECPYKDMEPEVYRIKCNDCIYCEDEHCTYYDDYDDCRFCGMCEEE